MIDSRPKEDGVYCLRRYKCDGGHRFSSLEIPVESVHGRNTMDAVTRGLRTHEQERINQAVAQAAEELRLLALRIEGAVA